MACSKDWFNTVMELQEFLEYTDDEEKLHIVAKRLLERVEPKQLRELMKECANYGDEKLKIVARKILKPEVTTTPLSPKRGWIVDDPILAMAGEPNEQRPNLASYSVDSLIKMWGLLRLQVIDRHFIVFLVPVNSKEHPAVVRIRTEMLLMFRRALIEVDVSTKSGERRLRVAFDAMTKTKGDTLHEMDTPGSATRLFWKWLQEIGLAEIFQSERARRTGLHPIEMARYGALLNDVMIETSSVVYAILAVIFDRIAPLVDRPEAVRKFCRSMIPRYSVADRKTICKVAENASKHRRPRDRKGTVVKSQGSSYLERLYDLLGGKRENFEYVAFGRSKQCGACGTTNRQKYLFTCKKCQQDGMYPKRRYCDEKCQRKDWPKHRREHIKHSNSLKKEEETKRKETSAIV